MVTDVFDKEENRKNYIRGMLKTLTKRGETVLRMYFGIDTERRLMKWTPSQGQFLL